MAHRSLTRCGPSKIKPAGRQTKRSTSPVLPSPVLPAVRLTPRFASMRDLDVIDSELRLLAAVRRVCREIDGRVPP